MSEGHTECQAGAQGAGAVPDEHLIGYIGMFMGWTRVHREMDEVWGRQICVGLFGQPPSGTGHERLPNYPNDLAAMWEVEERLHEQGLHNRYDMSLGDVTGFFESSDDDAFWLLRHATARQKALAAYEIAKEQHNER